jgi:hypothetical protein
MLQGIHQLQVSASFTAGISQKELGLLGRIKFQSKTGYTVFMSGTRFHNLKQSMKYHKLAQIKMSSIALTDQCL